MDIVSLSCFLLPYPKKCMIVYAWPLLESRGIKVCVFVVRPIKSLNQKDLTH